MDIVELGAIGELVGGVAVVASFVYVGVQVRHNTAALRSTAAGDLGEGLNNTILLVAGGGEPARIWFEASDNPGAMSDRDRLSADMIILSAFQSFDSAFLQARLGALDPDTVDMIHRRVRAFCRHPHFRDRWYRNPWEFADPLAQFVETELKRGSAS